MARSTGVLTADAGSDDPVAVAHPRALRSIRRRR